jgi:TruD family tRNA pseudouridine synthase
VRPAQLGRPLADRPGHGGGRQHPAVRSDDALAIRTCGLFGVDVEGGQARHAWHGCRGRAQCDAEDFVVDEISAYTPSETGEFLFLRVEKTGISAEQLVSHLARCLKIAHQDVGMAGMKDRQAVTRQMVSVPLRCLPLVESFEHEQIRILEIHRHPHKLRTGHLKGNRFSILIRKTSSGSKPVSRIISAISFKGWLSDLT